MDATVLVEAFDPSGSDRARRSRAAILDLIKTHPTPFDRRSYDPGHITASGLVLSPDRGMLLLVYHRRLQRWLQPGGHVEPGDLDVIETARREVLEETGVDLGELPEFRLVGVDVHKIPATRTEPAHLHHDLTFGFSADPVESSGSERAIWCPLDRLECYGVDQSLRSGLLRMITPSPPDLL